MARNELLTFNYAAFEKSESIMQNHLSIESYQMQDYNLKNINSC